MTVGISIGMPMSGSSIDLHGITAGNDVRIEGIHVHGTDLEAVAAAVVQPWRQLTGEQAATIAQLQQSLGANEAQIITFFHSIGEASVKPEQIGAKLVEMARRLKGLEAQAKAAPGDEPVTTQLKNDVRDALHRGELGRAGVLLARLTELQGEASDGQALEAAATCANQGDIAMTRLRYREAARHFGDAAARLPAGHEGERRTYLERQADALYLQGDEGGDEVALAEAIILYRCLSERSPSEHDAGKWAELRTKFGVGLQLQGWRDSDKTRLAEAVDVFRQVLKELSATHSPSTAFAQVRLGAALQALGWREGGTERLEEAVTTFRNTIAEVTTFPASKVEAWGPGFLQWLTEHNYGSAVEALGWRLHELGRTQEGIKRLKEAVEAYKRALMNSSAKTPQQRAVTQADLGRALVSLGRLERNTAHFENAVNAFLGASKELEREGLPRQWAEIQNRLGYAQETLAARLLEFDQAKAINLLEAAETTYRAVLEVRVRDRWPLEWAATKFNLGRLLYFKSTHTGRTETIKEAIKASYDALQERTRARVPADWADTTQLLADSLRALGDIVHLEVALTYLVSLHDAYQHELADSEKAGVIATSIKEVDNLLASKGVRTPVDPRARDQSGMPVT